MTDFLSKRAFFPLLLFLAPAFLYAGERTLPTEAEIDRAARWAEARWNVEPAVQAAEPPGLIVRANHDPVLKRRRGDTPLRLSDRELERGLYCHAVSHVDVVLPKPGKTFTALVGIDCNADTRGGKGSVRFGVRVDGELEFRSEILREGMEPVPVTVDLDGATSFSLCIEDGGDGISHDQSNWGDAKVEFEDGRSLFLDELPLRSSVRAAEGLPFSFVYGDRNSDEFLRQCRFTRNAEMLDDETRHAKTRYSIVWQDEKTGLEVRLVGLLYRDFPVVEWTVYFKNNGKEKTPILSRVRAADLEFDTDGHPEAMLHHHIGSPSTPNDYQPLETLLRPGGRHRMSGTGGRPSDRHWPYFNLAGRGSEGGGTIAVVGWPGQWEAEFSNPAEEDRRGCIRFEAGQEQFHAALLPGEEIRTPMIVLLFWDGDRLRSQNVWRRWFLEHNAPKLSNEKVPPYHWTINTSPYYWEMIHADTAKQIMFIDGLLERGLFIDYWWMDAGWYVNNGSWVNTGTWEVDQKRFPGGLRPISDHAKAKGVKTLVWFEPERVTAGTWLAEEHPDWVLGGKDGGILNLGHPDARHWLIEHIDGLIVSEGIGLYRQDFNIEPLGFWRAADAPDRQGMTENKHVCGYLAFWDELRRRHPDMPIDSCASGGRRNDLETLRRAIILHRTDNYETTGNQGQTYGIASWTPLYGIGAGGADAYHFRSMLTPYQNSSFDIRDENFDFAKARKYQADWRRINPYFLQDYYPLTPYTLDESAWLAWQHNAYDGRSGVVQVFKRPESPYTSARLKFHGLDPDAIYGFTDLDDRPFTHYLASGSEDTRIALRSDLGPAFFSGRELMEKGLPLCIEDRRVALILEYHALETAK